MGGRWPLLLAALAPGVHAEPAGGYAMKCESRRQRLRQGVYRHPRCGTRFRLLWVCHPRASACLRTLRLPRGGARGRTIRRYFLLRTLRERGRRRRIGRSPGPRCQ